MSNEVVVRQGEKYDYDQYDDLQRMVMPLVSIEDGNLQCWGTAMCIGAGWFLTARLRARPRLPLYVEPHRQDR